MNGGIISQGYQLNEISFPTRRCKTGKCWKIQQFFLFFFFFRGEIVKSTKFSCFSFFYIFFFILHSLSFQDFVDKILSWGRLSHPCSYLLLQNDKSQERDFFYFYIKSSWSNYTILICFSIRTFYCNLRNLIYLWPADQLSFVTFSLII